MCPALRWINACRCGNGQSSWYPWTTERKCLSSASLPIDFGQGGQLSWFLVRSPAIYVGRVLPDVWSHMQIKLEADHVREEKEQELDHKTSWRWRRRRRRKWGKLNCCWLVRQMADISRPGRMCAKDMLTRETNLPIMLSDAYRTHSRHPPKSVAMASIICILYSR